MFAVKVGVGAPQQSCLRAGRWELSWKLRNATGRGERTMHCKRAASLTNSRGDQVATVFRGDKLESWFSLTNSQKSFHGNHIHKLFAVTKSKNCSR